MHGCFGVPQNITRTLAFAAIAVTLAACAAGQRASGDHPYSARIQLDGAQEVPPVSTPAKGRGEITVTPDHSVSGRVIFTDLTPSAAHIHQGAAGKNGPVIITLKRTSDNTFTVPAGAKLSNAQYAAYKAGELYLNVHSARYPGGEMRGQISPGK